MKKIILPVTGLGLLLASCGGGSTSSADTTLPVVSLSTSQSGTTVTLTATATDNSGVVSKVDFYRNGTLVNSDTTAPYTYSFQVSAADNANVTFTAKAYDPAGNVGQASSSLNIYVAPKVTSTLYQGVWGWAIGDPVTGDIIDSGASIFSQQVTREGRTVAGGVYLNKAQTKQGLALLGPIVDAGELETAFTLDTDGTQIYFVGIDDDGAFEPYQGQPSFAGSGAIFDAAGEPSQSVAVVLVQTSTTVPTGAQAQALTKSNARQTALHALSDLKSGVKINSVRLRDVAGEATQIR